MGGTEFVSRAIAEYMISKGHEVSIFTRGIRKLTYGGSYMHYTGDRKNIGDVEKAIKDVAFDYVLDISAYNLIDITNLLKVLDTTELKRYVFCSTGAVYKPTEEIINEEYTRGYNENWGQYGLDKLEIENYLFNLYEKEKFPVSVFRPTYIYGKGSNLYREIYLFDRLKRSLAVPIPDSSSKVQFIYIDDLVRFVESIMFEDRTIGQAYNATNTEIIAWEKWVNTAAEVMGIDARIKKVNIGLGIKAREYFPFRDCTYLLNTDKSREHQLFIPSINLKEGLKLSYEWYRNTHPVIKDIKMNKIETVL